MNWFLAFIVLYIFGGIYTTSILLHWHKKAGIPFKGKTEKPFAIIIHFLFWWFVGILSIIDDILSIKKG